MAQPLTARQRQIMQAAVVLAALALAGGFYYWWSTRPYEAHAGAETRWLTGGKSRTLSVKVTSRDPSSQRESVLEGVVVRAFKPGGSAPVDGVTDQDGRAMVPIGSGRLTRLTINGVDLFDRNEWAAPSTDEGLRINVRVLDPQMMRVFRADDEPDEVAADVREQLDSLEATLRDPEGEWLMAWRMLLSLEEPGWVRIQRNLFDLSPRSDHLRPLALLIDPGSRLSGPMAEHYKAALDERLADESWAMNWARALLADPDVRAMLGRPWVGTYADPIEARLDVAFARAAYRKRFGYVWDGSPDEQRAALQRWRDYLATIDTESDINPVVLRRRPSQDRPPDSFNGSVGPFVGNGLPRIDEQGRLVTNPEDPGSDDPSQPPDSSEGPGDPESPEPDGADG